MAGTTFALVPQLAGTRPLIRLPASGEVTVGRSAGAQIQLNAAFISRRHARLIAEAGRAYVVPLCRDDKLVTVNGVPAARGARVELQAGDAVSFVKEEADFAYRAKARAAGGQRRPDGVGDGGRAPRPTATSRSPRRCICSAPSPRATACAATRAAASASSGGSPRSASVRSAARPCRSRSSRPSTSSTTPSRRGSAPCVPPNAGPGGTAIALASDAARRAPARAAAARRAGPRPRAAPPG